MDEQIRTEANKKRCFHAVPKHYIDRLRELFAPAPTMACVEAAVKAVENMSESERRELATSVNRDYSARKSANASRRFRGFGGGK